MRTGEARQSFLHYLSDQGQSLDQLAPSDAVEAMIRWYETERADDVESDMLLFQWSSLSSFYFDLTRQLIVAGHGAEDADDAFWQLNLTAYYSGTEESATLGTGEYWCHSPQGTATLRSFIDETGTTAYGRRQTPLQIELEFGPAG